MKKILAAILTLVLALGLLSACGSNDAAETVTDDTAEKTATAEEEETEPAEDSHQDPAAEDEEAEPAETETPDSANPEARYFILKDDMKVRKGPSADSEWVRTSELDEADKDKALKEENAVLAKGSSVECLEENGDWIRIPSGWICSYSKGRYFLIDAQFADRMEKQMNQFYEKVGVDRETSKKLNGTYQVNSDDSMDSIEFFENGEVAVHFAEAMYPETDEEGYVNGHYAVDGDKVYINYGGRVDAEVYVMSGKTLDKTSETIPIYHG